MEKNRILEILIDWNFWNQEIDCGIFREGYLKIIIEYIKTKQVVAIIGPRRAGKSYLIRQTIKRLIEKGNEARNMVHINFEDVRFRELNLNTIERAYETYLENIKPKKKPIIFLDEIPAISGWERWVRTIHELNKATIIVSGSSSKLLSKELGTLLTGRHLDIIVFPLNFNEFLKFKNLKVKDIPDIIKNRIKIKGYLNEYLEYGSFPRVVLVDKKIELLRTYFNDIIEEDVVKRYNIKRIDKLEVIAKYYLSNISSLHTFRSISKSMKISVDTVAKYSGYLRDGFLIFFIQRFSFSIKEQENSPRKVYAIDVGLANAVGFRFMENLGKLYENLTAIELKRWQAKNPLIEIYYWKDYYGREVDFVLKEGMEVKQLIQVCYDVEEHATKEREIKGLLKASKELKCNNLLIITEDYEETEEHKGKKIKFIPLWKWLLIEESYA